MQTVEFSVPTLSDGTGVGDLASVLIALNGVAHVAMHPGAHRVQVWYDPDFTNPAIISHAMEGAGYRGSGASGPAPSQMRGDRIDA